MYPTGPRTGENDAGASPRPPRVTARNTGCGGASRRAPCYDRPGDSSSLSPALPAAPSRAPLTYPASARDHPRPPPPSPPAAPRRSSLPLPAPSGRAGQGTAGQGRPSPRQAGPAALTERAGPAPPGPRPAAAAPWSRGRLRTPGLGRARARK